MLYLFAYQLEQPLSNYPELIQYIDELKPQARVMDNVWLLDTSDLPFNQQRQIKTLIGANDEFYLVDISKSIVAWSGIEEEVADFVGRFTEAVEQDVSTRLLTVAYDGGKTDGTPVTEVAGAEAQPLLRNLWQVQSSLAPEDFVRDLRRRLGDGGRLLVADVSLAPAAWSHLPEDTAYAAVAYTRTEEGNEQRQEF